MPGGGTGVSDVHKARGAGMDPVSVTACSWAAAGIPKRGTRGMPLLKSCRGHMSAWQSPSGQAQRAAENFFIKAWHFCPSSAIASWFSAEMPSR